ncbi:MAG TPA: peptidase M3 [Planctomycetaceae bacterium]|uniref:M3 family metallopeptidase n=1 Tax=Gimesia sp. TaxID=2024833 RepID=UPI000C5EDA99|nr:M3 family metallopeptidase [Gimesia sp.]MAX38679.1 peptidase M3 [Gimesia sp.]HAH46399.1 peptidase M3 [Planctomycetaceae bacterium]|tara:strand:+ start:18640 stop:20742 length:2103 start_codon:yes stop_codon:yes gene_type:complete
MDPQSSLSDNPLLVLEGLPRFDRIEPQHIQPAVKALLEQSEAGLKKIEAEAQPSWAGLLQPLEELDYPWERSWGSVGHLLGVKNTPEIREAYESVLPDIVAFSLSARQSKPIYEALVALRDSENWNSLNDAQKRIIEKRILSAELAGIGLSGEQLVRFNEIARELSSLSTKFANNVLDATKAFTLIITSADDVVGFPDSLKQLTAQSYNSWEEKTPEIEATPEEGPWRISLDFPCFGPFMQHCRKRELREKVYRAFITRASEGEINNAPLIPEILKLRKEKAQLLGYANFAEISLAEKMAPGIDAVLEMEERLRTASIDNGQQDLKELQEFAAAQGETEPIIQWDFAFWSERLREQRFSYTDEELRPYFSLEKVLDGLFQLVNRIFGITVTQVTDDIPVWNKDVRYFNIANESGENIAGFYLDPYARPADKRGGAWMDDCLGRKIVNGKVQLPVAHLVCNSTPPVGSKPSLMTFREVETLFHEFGHGLQHMLTTINEADAAGINGVEWDAVELASQFMENWCYHKPTLLGMAKHFETGETLPDELFEKIKAARNFQAGTQMLRQIQFGVVDLKLHSEFDPEGAESVFDVQREISKSTSVLPMLPEDRFLCSFQHIFAGGYAAGYFSYKWAEVLSADAFSAFEEAGLDDEKAVEATGRRFRDTILAMGGSRHPMDLFKEFRGREPSPEPLLRHTGLLSNEE